MIDIMLFAGLLIVVSFAVGIVVYTTVKVKLGTDLEIENIYRRAAEAEAATYRAQRNGWQERYHALIDGMSAGRRATQHTPSPLDPVMIKRMIGLCHPDKHSGSQAATEVTQYLMQLKDLDETS